MKVKLLIILLASLLMIMGCEDYISNQEKSATEFDANLIKSIQEATDKQDINAEDLPYASLTVLEQDYYDSYVEDAKIAPRLGYEVGLRRGKGAYGGDIGKTYFNLKGRELRGDKDSDKGGRGGKDGMECFSLVLPVTFIMPDGSEIIVENKEDWAKIKNWYEAHPDSKERPAIQYPVDVIFKDGNTVTVDNDEEMKGIHARCKEGGGGDDGNKDMGKCFELVFPVTFVMPDNSIMTIDSKEDMAQLRTWYADNPDIKVRPALQYPVEVKMEAGNIVTLNNDDEMKRLREYCGGKEGGDRGKEKCFEFVYPIAHIMPDGSTITVENKESMVEIKNWYVNHPDIKERPALQFPVVVVFEDGFTVTINNAEELRRVFARCDEGKGDGSGRP